MRGTYVPLLFMLGNFNLLLKSGKIIRMNENPNKEIDKEKKEQEAIAKERKALNFLVPFTGLIAMILGGVGIYFTLTDDNRNIFIFSIVLASLGLIGVVVGILSNIKSKKPKEKKQKEEDVLVD